MQDRAKELEKEREEDRAEERRRLAVREEQRAQEAQEHAKQRAENRKAYKKLLRELHGTTNPGPTADEYFYDALRNEWPFPMQGIRRYTMSNYAEFTSNGHSMLCDVVLENEKFIALVEVQHFLKQGHVYEFNRKLDKIVPIVLPDQYRHLQIMPVMACMGLHPKARVAAHKSGIAVLLPDGQKCKVECDHLHLRPPVDKLPGT